eukprot:Sspe_Gene.57641::Locus_31615_Transcript_1_1_Confidence_1.000_Length_2221::g.57641::m.57641
MLPTVEWPLLLRSLAILVVVVAGGRLVLRRVVGRLLHGCFPSLHRLSHLSVVLLLGAIAVSVQTSADQLGDFERRLQEAVQALLISNTNAAVEADLRWAAGQLSMMEAKRAAYGVGAPVLWGVTGFLATMGPRRAEVPTALQNRIVFAVASTVGVTMWVTYTDLRGPWYLVLTVLRGAAAVSLVMVYLLGGASRVAKDTDSIPPYDPRTWPPVQDIAPCPRAGKGITGEWLPRFDHHSTVLGVDVWLRNFGAYVATTLLHTLLAGLMLCLSIPKLREAAPLLHAGRAQTACEVPDYLLRHFGREPCRTSEGDGFMAAVVPLLLFAVPAIATGVGAAAFLCALRRAMANITAHELLLFRRRASLESSPSHAEALRGQDAILFGYRPAELCIEHIEGGAVGMSFAAHPEGRSLVLRKVQG